MGLFRRKEHSIGDASDGPWERDIVEKLAFAAIREQRRARRWGIFFKLLGFSYVIALLVLWWPSDIDTGLNVGKKHTALVELKGIIAPDSEASADNVITGLRNAFKDKKTKGVILRINSPGGSPVQSGYINDEIRRLKEKYPDIPVYAVVTDLCASGGYYAAVAADKIFVDKSSIVGSIGVLMSGFGFVDTLEKLGVERRLMTAGEHKGILDPFSPESEFDRRHVQELLDTLHAQFIDVVRKGRGERLKGSDEIFSGLFWSGEESIALGLADELGSSSYVAREVIGAEEIVDFTPEEDLAERLAKRLGAGVTTAWAKLLGLSGETGLR